MAVHKCENGSENFRGDSSWLVCHSHNEAFDYIFFLTYLFDHTGHWRRHMAKAPGAFANGVECSRRNIQKGSHDDMVLLSAHAKEMSLLLLLHRAAFNSVPKPPSLLLTMECSGLGIDQRYWKKVGSANQQWKSECLNVRKSECLKARPD